MIAWEENLATRKLLEDYQTFENVFLLNIPLPGGHSGIAKLILPPEIDLSKPSQSKKYPLIVEVYAGPDTNRVLDQFTLGYESYLISKRNVVYCSIDGRGSGLKEKDNVFAVNNKLGTVEVEDQITVTKYLQEKYDFIDRNRTAIWGWSYGGFSTAVALIKDTEKVFQCGISVAPVTSWIFYDSIYTERFMGLPTVEDNLVNYNASDVTRHVKELGTHKYLLIHGNADDNVHYQQAMVLSTALVKAGIEFEQVVSVDEYNFINSN